MRRSLNLAQKLLYVRSASQDCTACQQSEWSGSLGLVQSRSIATSSQSAEEFVALNNLADMPGASKQVTFCFKELSFAVKDDLQ